jgi:hypothetical protein
MKLDELVTISSGRTFKNGIPESNEPTHSVIQLRDFDRESEHRPIRWEQLSMTNLSASKTDNNLQADDVLIVAKGPVKKAIFLSTVPKNVVANQHFFILKVTETQKLLPEFLAHYLNSSEAQRWMNDHAGGSYQSTLSKTILARLPIPELNIDKQNLICGVANSVRKEIYLYQQLIQSREQEVNTIFKNVWPGAQ